MGLVRWSSFSSPSGDLEEGDFTEGEEGKRERLYSRYVCIYTETLDILAPEILSFI